MNPQAKRAKILSCSQESTVSIDYAAGVALEICWRAFALVMEFDAVANEGKWVDCFKCFCDSMLKLRPEVLKIVKKQD